MPLLELTHEWGDVTEESSEVRTRLALNAPAPVALEVDGVDVHYSASLNGERLLETDDRAMRIGGRDPAIAMNATLDHEAIPEWWAGHVARGERSELAVEPTLKLDGRLGSASLDTPTVRGELESDVLDSIAGLADALAEELAGLQRRIFGRALLAPVDTAAAWVVPDAGDDRARAVAENTGGRADGDAAGGEDSGPEPGGEAPAAAGEYGSASGAVAADGGIEASTVIADGTAGEDGATTAVRIAIQLRNGVGRTFPASRIGRWLLARLGFRLAMNGVTMGEALFDDVHSVPDGQQRTYTVTIPLDDEALKEWWARHVDDDEETTVEIDVIADLPLLDRLRPTIHRFTDRLSTDILDAVTLRA